MGSFINFVRLALLSFSYSVKHKKIDEGVIREWVDDVLRKYHITVECKGEFDAEKSVIMANHSSYFDILALYKCIKSKLLWVAKKELFGYPVIGKALKGIGAVGVNRKDDKEAAIALMRVLKNFKSGAVVVFPQGTRKNRNAFKKGGILIAKKKNIPILPIKIVGSESIMPVGKLELNSGSVIVKAFEKIDVSRLESDEIERVVRSKIYD
ncbi:lysophospholipid acyltransferase family protein [Hippea alviniae]|uniref:lysophospholipid acyltransferase family protein n=1 Tax=Hippea alviniae TaxID=1279027 RepID=UPI0003B57D46|nr:lysophospholipid acyltransferase family protein [Hippea alviniae]